MQGPKGTFHVNSLSPSPLLLLLVHHLMTTPTVFALLVDDLSITCSSSINDVTEALWDSDVNRLRSDQYTLNLQSRASSSASEDRASSPLFTYVDPAVLTSSTFKAFVALQDNYDPAPHADDRLSTSDVNEADVFLDAVLQTKVMHTLLKYLMCRSLNQWGNWDHMLIRCGGSVTSVRGDVLLCAPQMFDKTRRVCARCCGACGSNPTREFSLDSSGFEHVMVGEFQTNTTVNGLHSWLAYYLKERFESISYHGYVETAEPDIIAVDYDWRGRHKSMGTFFVGTSPEFDMALYSLSGLTNTSQVLLSGHTVRLQFYDLEHVNGLQVASAYPII